MKKVIKNFIKNLYQSTLFVKIFNLLHIKTKGCKGNKISINSPVGKTGTVFIANKSKYNNILVDYDNTIKNLHIKIFGNNNSVVIEKGCFIENLTIWIEDDNNTVFIGKNSSLCGQLKLSSIEGTQIIIGEGCLFSSEIDVRTGDGHALLDEDSNRINFSKDVIIDQHTWVGYRAMILKGAHIYKNSVVGAGSIVTSDIGEGDVAIAGSPAKIVKRNINWNFDRNFGGEGTIIINLLLFTPKRKTA